MAYDLTDLQLFLQVVDQGSITRGADRSHLSLASASARINAMEKALGAPLLIRHRRGVVPSPAGWLLVAHAREVVGQIARMRSELSRYSDGLRSTLVISANTSATETLVSSVIVDFLADNPDIDLELEERPSHEIVAAVTDGRAELGIIADTHPFVGYTEGNPLQEHLSGQTQPLGLRPRYRAHLPTTEAICGAVAVGVGIAVVPARAVVRWRRTYDLRVVDLTNPWAKRNLLLCGRRWSGLSEAAAALAARLRAHGAPAATPGDGGAEGA
ncbi:LysR family transcriptional regulator [Microbispora bryophytorum]|uniref:LysR family transcriptional regulator n=1 Tax=Microbispora bryophytorum TaxID=1460882 RepID=UPI0033E970AB